MGKKQRERRDDGKRPSQGLGRAVRRAQRVGERARRGGLDLDERPAEPAERPKVPGKKTELRRRDRSKERRRRPRREPSDVPCAERGEVPGRFRAISNGPMSDRCRGEEAGSFGVIISAEYSVCCDRPKILCCHWSIDPAQNPRLFCDELALLRRTFLKSHQQHTYTKWPP